MLTHLGVRNIGVIADAALGLTPGLNVITGETGAGKTLLLGGLRLLLGERADSGLVGRAGAEARADGLFIVDGEEIGVTRVVPSDGRSRAYVDGVMVSATALGERIGPVVEVVGQHDQLSLRRPAFVLGLIDGLGGDEMATTMAVYRQTWETLKQVEGDLEALGGDEMSLRRDLDLVAFQAAEIEAERLAGDEDATLEAEASRLRNIAEITSHVSESWRLLEQMREEGGEVIARLRKISDLDPASIALAGQAELMGETVQDMTRSVNDLADALEPDPGRLEHIERRLTVLGDLKRKYGRTIEEVIRFGANARSRQEEIEGLLGRADAIDTQLREARARVEEAAERLRQARRRFSLPVTDKAVQHLEDLGMEGPQVEIRLEPIEPGPNGADRAEIWFASDQHLDPTPVGVGASGGELSRLVLAVRLAARGQQRTTLVFDEIDTGVGGATALAMGRKLAALGRDCQVICVTHLPQVAAFADAHHVVTRDGPTAKAALVTGDERVREVTRMLAGLPESIAGHQAATELLLEGRARAEG